MYLGIGYDVHRLKRGIPLTLGGVRIPHTHGLAGHSDADVLVHALMDALLGAAGLPDIGKLFPPSDGRYRGISSVLLLERVVRRLSARKLAVGNVSVTVIAERPKIGPLAAQMKKNLSRVIGVAPARIGLSATTNEKLGFIGRGEGIAAFAVATVVPARKKR